tara:strand:- start:43 stop:618 length:576 start_codon:yes stop_codon:yes gene_type:complete
MNCKFCDDRLRSKEAKENGYHAICFKKSGGIVLHKKCSSCNAKLVNRENQILGHHKYCKTKSPKKPKQIKDITEPNSITKPLTTSTKKNSLKEFLITSLMAAKKALDETSSIFKEADMRLGRFKKKLTEEDAYEIAGIEVEQKTFRRGLMAKAYSDAKGDKQLQQALYCQYRAKQLIELIELMEMRGFDGQ